MTVDQLAAQAAADERMYAAMYDAVKVAQYAQASADSKAEASELVGLYAGRRNMAAAPTSENFVITQVK